MISSMLIGRLGNSMFQIAMSIAYARKYGYQWAVQAIPHNNESAIHRVYPNLPKTNDRGIRYQEHPAKYCTQHESHYDLCHFDYHHIPDVGPDVYFVGFWQSYKYFEHCKEEIQKVFALPHVEGYEEYVSIHVRRGDYVQHSGSFPPITDEYLQKSIEIIWDEVGKENFMVFSDDSEWCKQWALKNSRFNIIVSEGRNELQDLSLMASCGHHIIANSSFSWWSAYLGHNPDRIVISPSAQTWFGPTSGVKKPVVDLIPSNWIQIHTR